jgi:drug/metabolite transporter (DMT)-like permease
VPPLAASTKANSPEASGRRLTQPVNSIVVGFWNCAWTYGPASAAATPATSTANSVRVIDTPDAFSSRLGPNSRAAAPALYSIRDARRPARTLDMNLVLYAALCLIWGSTWLVIKVGYGGLGPFNVAAVRFLVAGLVLAAAMPMLGARWPRRRTEWALVTFVGVVMFGADYGLIYWGEQFLDSGLTSILFATLPLVTIGFAHVYIPGDRITPRKLAGTSLAFLGSVALFGDRTSLDAALVWPMVAVLASTVCAAAAAVAAKLHGGTLHPVALNAPSMLVGALVLALASVASGHTLTLPADLGTWAAVLYLALAGSVFTFLVYFSLLKTWSVTSLSFISVFTPAIALALGFALLDEQPTLWTGVGATLILGGVSLALSPDRRDGG